MRLNSPPPLTRAREPAAARRRFGQNFLVDRAAVRRIVAAVDSSEREAILEIGPGRGALTEALLETAAPIAAVEIDRELAALLRQRFPAERLTILERDVLHLELAEVVSALGLPPGSRLVVAGNLPYNISKPIASKLVRDRAHVARAIVMFQKEVADRLTAKPGTRAYGPLTILTGRAFEISRLFDLPPAAFRPRPKVFSTLTLWSPRPEADLPVALEEPLRRCLAACFAHRRQTLQNNLRAGLAGGEREARALLAKAGLEATLRAEAISPPEFMRLAALWPRERRDPAR